MILLVRTSSSRRRLWNGPVRDQMRDTLGEKVLNGLMRRSVNITLEKI